MGQTPPKMTDKLCLIIPYRTQPVDVPSFFLDNDNKAEALLLDCLRFDIMHKHLSDCSTRRIKIKRLCYDCGETIHENTFLQTCGNRYCKKCYSKRVAIAHRKIFDNYRKHYHKRCIHLILTTPRGFYTKKTKKDFEYRIYRFFLKMRQHGYTMIGIKGIDLTLRNAAVYLHCHIALRITHQLTTPFKKLLRDTWRQVSQLDNAVLKVKYSSTNNVLSYIAKRTAGLIGHGKTPMFLSDYMTEQQYFSSFYKTRYVTPIGISCNIAPNFKQIICPKCGNDCNFTTIIEEIDIIPHNGSPPLEKYYKIDGFD